MPCVHFENTNVCYDKFGSGEAILFIHPPGLGRLVFQYQRDLANHYQLIIPDLSGHGQSNAKMNHPCTMIEQYVQEIKHIIEEENLDDVILCAYSAGGVIAQSFTVQYPNMVKALIISGAYPKVDTVGLEWMYRIAEGIVVKNPNKLAEILAFSNANNLEDEQKLYEHMLQTDPVIWLRFYLDTHHYNQVSQLPSIQCPTLLIYGERTSWIHHHKLFYQRQANMDIAFVEDAFHQVPSKNPVAFNHLVKQFINKL
ncbi:AB hydrolase superfamily protein YvaM [Paraliobacillus sp. PM-2]|uniref:alpha/beta fold hydrolase n=1 Tax=Paraliobacillus sp. PM-2 TaxID=1462524 RepID=UPI00061C67A3|nr:alpha/beta hydrolase [Paraliobacillus sp. PM-2]CQR46627.1 AB hydrolase superfamily protein YvaM [Paraliobacillus sp. PM-2]